MGLIPLISNIEINSKRECNCSIGCDLCQVELNLNIECSDSELPLSVYSRHLISSNSDIQPVEDILLVKLKINKYIFANYFTH